MTAIILKSHTVICVHCGFEYTITYNTTFKMLRRKLRFCTYCGEHLVTSIPADSPIEEDKDNTDTNAIR